MTADPRATHPLAADEVRRLARDLLPRTAEMAAGITDGVLEAVPDLAPPTSIEALDHLRESTEQNLGAILSTLAFGLTPVGVEPPSGTHQLLRDLVTEGGDITHLLRAYRVGHGLVWKMWAAHVRDSTVDADVHEVLRLSSEHLFSYIDSVCQRIVDDHTAEAGTPMPDGSRDHRSKAEIVRALLGTEPVDLAWASMNLRYDLTRTHVALVATAVHPDARVRTELQRVVDVLGAPAFVLPDGDGSWSAWTCWTGQPPDDLIATLASTSVDGVLLGVGEPGGGRLGFRRSHAQAREAENVARLATEPTPAVVRHRDIEIAAILCRDPERARRLADERLGPLAADDETGDRLRTTLRTLFAHGNNRRSTAAALNIHIKTVSYRITQAEQLLGHAIISDIDLQAALLVDQTLRGGK